MFSCGSNQLLMISSAISPGFNESMLTAIALFNSLFLQCDDVPFGDLK